MGGSTGSTQQVLGERFVIEREVGRGGVGIVYRAFDRTTQQHVALKVIAVPGIDAGEEARFAREGRVLSELSHPSIVKLVAFGQLEHGEPYVAMEWLEGEDVAHRNRRAPLGLAASLRVASEVAEALDAAHRAGIVHRDVKPSNIILVEHDGALRAKLVDFGVALAGDAQLTRTGAIVGTPAYMAPEQARGDGEINERADMYALGATLFEMVAGRPPHVGPTPVAILAKLVTTPPPRLSDIVSNAPQGLDALLASLLSTDPNERPSAGLVAAHLLRLAEAFAAGGSLHEHRDGVAGLSAESLTSKTAGGSRLVTSILATHVPKGDVRAQLLAFLKDHGADATELGGDAIVAHLGARKALGDEAARAVELAMELARYNAAIGIATGRTRIDRTRPTGEVVDRAASLSRDAKRGQVLADTTTSELVRSRYEFQLRNDGSAVVGQVLASKREGLSGAPFVGRLAELAQITGAFERCVEDETPIVVTVSGPPGIGKTRLRKEALARITANASGAKVVLTQCEAFAQSHALGVVADIARGLSRLTKGATLQDALDATDVLIATSDAIIAEGARDVIARLMANEALPQDAHGARDVLWITLTEILVRSCVQAPLVVVVEDVQWADAESLAWLDHLVGRAAAQPLCIFATARPSFWRDTADRFGGRDHVRIELRPLAKKTVRAMAKAILGSRSVNAHGEDVADSIASQAGGSPLFAEELARLAAQGRGASKAASIEAAMQVHLDSVDDAAREAAAQLAVFGPVGWDAGLEAMGVADAQDLLRSLAGAEVLVEQASSRFRDTREWAFKHALMREVAYASLGEQVLRQLHVRAGQWLARVGEDDAVVARHLELGHENTKAASYLEKAARRALAANSLPDAMSMAERALAFAEDKPTAFARAQILDEAWNRLDARAGERETAVRALEEAVHDAASEIRARGARVRYEDACGGGHETSVKLDQVRRDAQAAGLADEEARSTAALAARYAFASELDAAEEMADELLSIARKHGIAGAAVDAWQTLAVVRQTRGQVGAALEARRSAARAASEAGLKTREATLTINVGFALTTLGAKAEARVAIEAGIALAQAIGSPGTERHGKMILLCWAATFDGDPQLDALLAEPRTIADGAVSGGWVAHDRATLGVLYYRGVELLRSRSPQHAEHARTLLRTAALGYRATNMLDVVPVALGMWAEAERRCGDPLRARELASEAAALLDEGSPSLMNEAPVFLALHDACVDLGFEEEARAAISRGIPRLVTRVQGLVGTPYGPPFLRNLAPNAGLIDAGDHYKLVPAPIRELIARSSVMPPISST